MNTKLGLWNKIAAYSLKKYLKACLKKHKYLQNNQDHGPAENTNDIKTLKISTHEYTFSQTFVW